MRLRGEGGDWRGRDEIEERGGIEEGGGGMRLRGRDEIEGEG